MALCFRILFLQTIGMLAVSFSYAFPPGDQTSEVASELLVSNIHDIKDFKEQLAQDREQNGDETQFWMAYLEYRIVMLGDEDKRIRNHRLKRCATDLESIEENSPYYAASQAVYALCLGRRISLSPMRGIFLGPKADKAKKHALATAGDDPAVLLWAAIDDYHTPSRWGGDRDRSQERFQKVVAGLAGNKSEFARWICSEAYAYLAMIEANNSKSEAARKMMAAARRVAPESVWLDSIEAELGLATD